ncbi:hypothetical protein [Lactococcus petauri]|uniref:hypothetical protein n=1 Tax=Lactococcus petauri TaxID=1940789 RepID=UPI00385487CC
MRKILLYLLILPILSACGAGLKGEEDQASKQEQGVSEVKEKPNEPNQIEKNTSSKDINSFTRNDHEYNIDVVAGATSGVYNGNAYTGQEKMEKMYWSGRPEIGTVIGEYYYDTFEFDGGYLATLDVVTQRDKLISVEFDEKAPDNYYSPEWVGQTKRLSGYANFQAENSRTDVTLVTLVNAMTFLEAQMLEKNSLIGYFYSVKGASNSVRNGYIPLAEQLEKKLKNKSSETYYALTKSLGRGLYGRLIVIKDKSKDQIVDVRYDEYFADSKNEIPEESLKEYFRQSKYYSRSYSTKSGQNFRELVDDLKTEVLSQQKLQVTIKDSSLQENYSQFIQEMTKMLTQ